MPRSSTGIRVVLDTNVLVSGIMYSGNERKVLDLGVLGMISVYLSPHILNELAGVLSRKFNRGEPQITEDIETICRWVAVVEPTETVSLISRNPADDRILECCLEANAHYLITGDRRDLLPLGSFRGVSIVNAIEFLSIFSRLQL